MQEVTDPNLEETLSAKRLSKYAAENMPKDLSRLEKFEAFLSWHVDLNETKMLSRDELLAEAVSGA